MEIIKKNIEPQDEFLTDENRETHIEENYFFKNEQWKIVIKTRVIPKPNPTKQEIIEKIIHSEEVKSEWINLDDKEIWEIILEKHYNGNINWQLASLVKSQIKIIAVLKNIIGADMTKKIFGEEIENLRQISETRKICGLNEFDLSNLF